MRFELSADIVVGQNGLFLLQLWRFSSTGGMPVKEAQAVEGPFFTAAEARSCGRNKYGLTDSQIKQRAARK